ncbi:hypothetical protein [Psychrobacter sp. FME5]|uniref:hypothetical protein n=1 Tax=Psychrobacter sp. FME5 TaxID=2487706 RepID=UPI0017883EF1|nr:hypothetical protein [Psychrobacter sp. FME5]MBE0444768.1 hypothetical protein [Psychrobacter sp. FME5]
MSILIGVGVVSTMTVLYLGRKGWHAFHQAVGITPGVLVYQDAKAPLSLSHIKWQQLNLNKKHLKNLSDNQLHQLQRIDEKVNSYQAYQKALPDQSKTPAVTEQQFVLHKMLHTRLPEMLASYYHLTNININANHVNEAKDGEKSEANELLQKVLNNIEQRLDKLLAQMEAQQLQQLRVMDSYIESHDS